MCPRHWFLVPTPLRTEVWRAYRPGPAIPTEAYLDAAREAINLVAYQENKPPLPATADIIKTLEIMLERHK